MQGLFFVQSITTGGLGSQIIFGCDQNADAIDLDLDFNPELS
jgi:hypothetical protein